MVHHISAKQASAHRVVRVPVDFIPSGIRRRSSGRALPLHVRRTKRGSPKQASSEAERSSADMQTAEAPVSLTGDPSQGAVGAPLTKAIREARPAADQDSRSLQRASSVSLPDTSLVAKLAKEQKAVGVVAVAVTVGAVVALKEARRTSSS